MDQHDEVAGPVTPELVRVGVRLGLLLVLPAVVLLVVLPRSSAEFVITVFTLAIGLVLLGFTAFLAWLLQRD